jgi:hypothetical protein
MQRVRSQLQSLLVIARFICDGSSRELDEFLLFGKCKRSRKGI